MTRLSRSQLPARAARLNQREQAILATVERLRLLRADHVRRLFFDDISSDAGSARLSRRSLATLVEDGLLSRLERRVGGARAGSSGHVYTITAAGRRLNAYRRGTGTPSNRGVHEPGQPFVAHTLAIADLYLALVEAERAGTLELLGFESEPTCWRTFTGPVGATQTLKPDAYLRVGADEYEYASLVEVDCGTEGRSALVRKAHVYLSYWRSGREQAAERGLFPKVVWIAAADSRARFLGELLDALPDDGKQLFAATTTAEAIGVLSGTAAASTYGGAG
jgi:hypothetical protein